MHFSELTASGFRCFKEDQRARLAPLTLLVGENSTGKTSILALVRALWDVAFRQQVPDFKEPPYDLGSFDEIAHYRGGRGGRAQEFQVGFSVKAPGRSRRRKGVGTASRYGFIFQKDGSAPIPRVRRIEDRHGTTWAEIRTTPNNRLSFRFATPDGEWRLADSEMAGISLPRELWEPGQRVLPPVGYPLRRILFGGEDATHRLEGVGTTSDPPTAGNIRALMGLETHFGQAMPRPFAGAPVRSRPQRNYEPSHAMQDAKGEHIPMLLYTLFRQNEEAWKSLKSGLERFGQRSGLFDEITIQSLGGKDSDPFQVRVRKHDQHGRRSLGPYRSIIDVGYGVSQALPVITELLRPGEPRMFLLQQPEVHLHPSAQAALGSLFCEAAGSRQQVIVETHSDHLIDRIRMDIRDGTTGLKPKDVSILYFERKNLGVTIHSLGWDANGNLNAHEGTIPDGYRQFFRAERRRSLGL